jgi:hypothetical protein
VQALQRGVRHGLVSVSPVRRVNRQSAAPEIPPEGIIFLHVVRVV